MSVVTDMIRKDHRKVEELFTQFEQTGDYEIAKQICGELTAHAILEEELVYPILRNKVDKGDAEHAQDEHDEAKKLIARIQEMESTDSDLKKTVTKLKESISHHVKEEESKILPEMDEQVGDELDSIQGEFIQRKQQLVTVFVNDAEPIDIVDLSKDELIERAQEMGISADSSMTKESLLAALSRQL